MFAYILALFSLHNYVNEQSKDWFSVEEEIIIQLLHQIVNKAVEDFLQLVLVEEIDEFSIAVLSLCRFCVLHKGFEFIFLRHHSFQKNTFQSSEALDWVLLRFAICLLRENKYFQIILSSLNFHVRLFQFQKVILILFACYLTNRIKFSIAERVVFGLSLI